MSFTLLTGIPKLLLSKQHFPSCHLVSLEKSREAENTLVTLFNIHVLFNICLLFILAYKIKVYSKISNVSARWSPYSRYHYFGNEPPFSGHLRIWEISFPVRLERRATLSFRISECVNISELNMLNILKYKVRNQKVSHFKADKNKNSVLSTNCSFWRKDSKKIFSNINAK